MLHRTVGVSLDEYRKYMHRSFDAMCQQDLSVVATDTVSNKIVGCLVACDYALAEQGSTDMPECMKPVSALLQKLDSLYREGRCIEPGDYLLVDMVAVSSEVRNRGIYRTLRQAVHQIGYDAGFKWVVGELSSAATQRVCRSEFGHTVRVEINYQNFEFCGRRPFALIGDPDSIQLVEGKLNKSKR